MNQFNLPPTVNHYPGKMKRKASKFTPEETFLGRIYSLIHQRAEYLRQQQAATNAQSDQGEVATAATQTNQPSRQRSSQ